MRENLKFFKNSAYKRVFKELKRKWEIYGKFTGIIKLENLSQEEKRAIESFLGRYVEEKNIKIKAIEFQEALEKSKFKEISLLEILEEYYGEKILTNKNKKENEERLKEESFERVVKNLETLGKIGKNVELLLEKIKKNYKYQMEEIVINSLKAIDFLERTEKKIKLAMLANFITFNPHYFDRGEISGNYLIYLLTQLENIEVPNDSESIVELYFKYGIEGDIISSFTTAFGIKLYREDGEHLAYSEFIRRGESYLISLSNLKEIVKAQGVNNKIYIVENQMVFSYLCEIFKDKKVSLLCTSGQFKTASLYLIDLLCQNSNEIYYSGDFDGEGLEMAQRIIRRGKGKIKAWRFQVENYIKIDSQKEMSEISLKKLDKIDEETLLEVVKIMKKEKKAKYQESLLEELVKDILKSC